MTTTQMPEQEKSVPVSTFPEPPPFARTSRERKKSLWSGGIVVGAVRDSLIKLNPRTLMKNPVMFVVEVGAVITTYDLIRDWVQHRRRFRI